MGGRFGADGRCVDPGKQVMLQRESKMRLGIFISCSYNCNAKGEVVASLKAVGTDWIAAMSMTARDKQRRGGGQMNETRKGYPKKPIQMPKASP